MLARTNAVTSVCHERVCLKGVSTEMCGFSFHCSRFPPRGSIEYRRVSTQSAPTPFIHLPCACLSRYRGWGSNPHGAFAPRDFKSLASPIPPPRLIVGITLQPPRVPVSACALQLICPLAVHCASRCRGGVVTQGSAKPCTPVQFRSAPDRRENASTSARPPSREACFGRSASRRVGGLSGDMPILTHYRTAIGSTETIYDCLDTNRGPFPYSHWQYGNDP